MAADACEAVDVFNIRVTRQPMVSPLTCAYPRMCGFASETSELFSKCSLCQWLQEKHFNLVQGTDEPLRFHPCIHRSLRNWSNKIRFLQDMDIHFMTARNEPSIGLTPKSWASIKPWLRNTGLAKNVFFACLGRGQFDCNRPLV